MDAAFEASTMRKVYLRLLPFAVLSYVLAYLDRINVSFAALTMRGDLNISAGGFATGSFSGGLYCLALLSLVSSVVCALFLHIPDVISSTQRRAEVAPAQ